MSDFVLPETRYALSGDVNIAYQIMGDGPVDLVLVPGLISHVEFLPLSAQNSEPFAGERWRWRCGTLLLPPPCSSNRA